MCQMSFLNLHETRLNKRLFLLMGSFGSVVHKDGWGISDQNGELWKCDYPMYYTTDNGKIVRKYAPNSSEPFMGHIRQASPQVPVNDENSHPFKLGDIVLQHNGRLTPKKPENFTVEYQEIEYDSAGKVVLDTKTQQPKTKTIKRSDSIVFFERLVEIMSGKDNTELTEPLTIEVALQKTMEEFYGKFAFMINYEGNFYIVRGKTADLFISYLVDAEGKRLGYAINTSKDVLETCTILLSNLEQLDGRSALIFSSPEALETETIYIAEQFGLKKIGEIKENYSAYTSITHPTSAIQRYGGREDWGDGDENFTQIGTGGGSQTEIQKYVRIIFEFMNEFSLAPRDIQNLLLLCYGSSMLEVDEKILRHFCTKVLQRLQSATTKIFRKRLSRALGHMPLSHVHTCKIENFRYPWMMNTKEKQLELIGILEKEMAL